MARLNARWDNFTNRGQIWDHFWQDASSLTVTTYNQVGQAQCSVALSISTYSSSANAQANILTTYISSAQTQATIVVTENVYGQSQVSIVTTYQEYGQAQTNVLATSQSYGQSLASLKAVYDASGQAQSQIVATSYGYAIAQSQILSTYLVYSNAQSAILQIYLCYSQAQVSILVTDLAYAQSSASIQAIDRAFAQAETSILSEYQVYAQAFAQILITDYAYAQANSQIILTNYAVGNSVTQILATSSEGGQAQANILTIYQVYSQAETQVTIPGLETTYQAYAQALAIIQIFGPSVYFYDSFTRTTTAPPANIGTADTGQTWYWNDYDENFGFALSNLHVESGALVLPNDGPNDSSYDAMHGASSIDEGEFLIDFWVPAAEDINLDLRWYDKNWYAIAYDNTATTFILRGELGDIEVSVIDRNAWHRLRVIVEKNIPSVKAHIWKIGETEPITWTQLQSTWGYIQSNLDNISNYGVPYRDLLPIFDIYYTPANEPAKFDNITVSGYAYYTLYNQGFGLAQTQINYLGGFGQAQAHIHSYDVPQWAQSQAWTVYRGTGGEYIWPQFGQALADIKSPFGQGQALAVIAIQRYSTLFSDTFSRTVSNNTWGNPDIGSPTYDATIYTGYNSVMSVNGSKGLITVPAGDWSDGKDFKFGANFYNFDMYFETKLTVVGDPLATLSSYYLVRDTGTGTSYWNTGAYLYIEDMYARLRANYGNDNSIRYDLPYNPQVVNAIKIKAQDDTIYAKFWPITESEPVDWQLTLVLTNVNDLVPGFMMWEPYANHDDNSTNPMVIEFDNITIGAVGPFVYNQGQSQALAQILTTYQQYGQAHVTLNQSQYTGQALASILSVYQEYSQAQASIRKSAGYANVQTKIAFPADYYRDIVAADGATHFYGMRVDSGNNYNTLKDELSTYNNNTYYYGQYGAIVPSPVSPERIGLNLGYYLAYRGWTNDLWGIPEFVTPTWSYDGWVQAPSTSPALATAFGLYAQYSYHYFDVYFGSVTNQDTAGTKIVVMAYEYGASMTYYDTGVTYVADAWYHIAVTLENKIFKVYINGTLTNTISRPFWNPSGTPYSNFYLGYSSYYGSGTGYVGGYDNFAVYPIALDQPTIAKHYSQGGMYGLAQAQVLLNQSWGFGQADAQLIAFNINAYAQAGFLYAQGIMTAQAQAIILVTYPRMGYVEKIIADGPTAYWSLNESTGTIAYDQMGNYNGEYINSPLLGQTGIITGYSDTSVGFNISSNTNAQMRAAPTLNFGGGNFSIELWVYPISGGSWPVLIDKGAGGGNQLLYYWTSGGGANLKINGSERISATVTANSWHHLVVTYNTSGYDLRLYVDGSLANSVSYNIGTLNTSDYWRVGTGASGGDNWAKNYVDEVALYNYTLSPTQISSHYYNNIPLEGPFGQALATIAGTMRGYGQALARVLDTSRYGSTVEADVPVTFLRLKETSGTDALDQTSAQKGIYGGGQTLNQTSPLTSPNNTDAKAIYLNATGSSYVDILSAYDGSSLLANTFTIEFWAKSDNNTITIYPQTASGTQGTSGQRYVWGAEANYGIGVSLGTNGITVVEHGSNYMPPVSVYSGALGTDWHYIVVTVANHISKIYLDGVLVNTGVQSYTGTLYSPRYIGSGSWSAGWSGYVAEPAIYNYVLPDDRILEHYLRGSYGNGYGQANSWTVYRNGDWYVWPQFGQANSRIMYSGLTTYGQAQTQIGSFQYGQAIAQITNTTDGYRLAVLNDRPMFYFPLDESSYTGTLTNLIGRRDTAIWDGSGASFLQPPALLSGTSIDFNGKAASLNLPINYGTIQENLIVPGTLLSSPQNMWKISNAFWLNAGESITISVTNLYNNGQNISLGMWGERSGDNQYDFIGSNVTGTFTRTASQYDIYYIYVWPNSGGVPPTGSGTYIRPNKGESTLPMEYASPITIEGWVKWDGTTAQRMILGFNSNDVIVRNSGQIGFNDGSGNYYETSAGTLVNDRWHHFAAVIYNAQSASTANKMYVDGTLRSLTGSTGVRYLDQRFVLGGWIDNTNYQWPATLDEIAVFNYELTAGQILAHYLSRIILWSAQAQARIIGFNYPVYAQAMTQVGGFQYAQAAAQIKAIDWPQQGLATSLITRDGEGLVRMIWTGEYTPYPENIIAWGIEDQSGQIYYDDGTGPPDYPGTNAGAAWTTRFVADATGTWSFRTVSDDNSEIIIGGTVVVANYDSSFFSGGHGDRDISGTIALVAGQEYNLHVRWTQGGGPYTIHVYYKRPADSSWNLLLDNKPPWLPVSKIRVSAHALAQILRPPQINQSAQAQARILAYKVKEYGQAQSRLLAFNQNVGGQALAFVGHFQSGNALAHILAINVNRYSQAQANILKLAGYGQAQSKLNAFDVNRHAIAQARLIAFNVNGFGQARVTILRSASGLTQAQIKQTYPLFHLNNYALSSLGATATALPAELTIPDPNDPNYGGPINTIDSNSLSLWDSTVNVAPENDDERVKLIIDLGQTRIITGYYILPDKYNATVNLQYSQNNSNWYNAVTDIYLPVNISTPLSGDNAVRGFIAPINARWWRLIVINGGDGDRISLATFGVGVGSIQSGTFAQAAAMFGHFQVAQAAFYISPAFDQNIYGQAQADIKQTYQTHSQSQAWMIPPTQWSQALSRIIQTYAVSANALVWMIPPTQWSQSGAKINAYNVNSSGYANSWLIGHYSKFANAKTYITKPIGHAYAAVSIFRMGNIARGGAIAYIGHFQFAQSLAFIVKSMAYSNAQTIIKQDYSKYSQAAVAIQRFDRWGNAQVSIVQVYQVYAQATVVLNQSWGIGQSLARIINTYFPSANARTHIKDTYRSYTQAEAWITLRNLKAYSQAGIFIVKTVFRAAQAQVQIGGFQYSQAQARILAYNVPKLAQSAGYILANINIVPPIPTSGMARYLVQYNGQLVPGYAQNEDYDSTANLTSHYTAYFDSSISEYIGLTNKTINLTMKVWEPTYLECKLKVQEAATILRSVRKSFARLYIQRTDRYYLAMPKSLKMSKDVSSSAKFIDYIIEFEAKPWIIEDRINTISGTGVIDTGARFGGWTPTTILVTGTDITISGLTEQGQDTGTISISGYVENFVVDTENFTSGNNAVITPKNYGIYVGPGKTYFTISGATSCIITYQNRWYL